VLKTNWLEKSYLFLAGTILLSFGMNDRAEAQPGHVPQTNTDDDNLMSEMADKAAAITQKMAKMAESKVKPRAIQFYSQNCPFCVMFDQVIDNVKGKFADKVDFQLVDARDPANAELVARYNVTQVPTLMCVDEEGDKVSGIIGYMGADDVNWALYRLVTSGQQAYAAGH
jgi:thiol-disulfide isomerase/thioredoxin